MLKFTEIKFQNNENYKKMTIFDHLFAKIWFHVKSKWRWNNQISKKSSLNFTFWKFLEHSEFALFNNASFFCKVRTRSSKRPQERKGLYLESRYWGCFWHETASNGENFLFSGWDHFLFPWFCFYLFFFPENEWSFLISNPKS